MTTAPQPVHLYVGRGRTFADNVLCGHPEGPDTWVSENGLEVTCPACQDLMRAATTFDDEDDPWDS